MNFFIDALFLLSCIIMIILIPVRIIILIKDFSTKNSYGGSMTIGNREVQEDCFLIKDKGSSLLMVLADGSGETYGGKIASRTAITTFDDIFSTTNVIENPSYFFKKTFTKANTEILNNLDNGQSGFASVAACLIYKNMLYYSVVGNVRVYVYRKGDLVLVSTGHTIGGLAKQEFISGKITRTEALNTLNNNRLYNYLGQDEFNDIELFDEPITLNPKDIIIAMTDGLYDLLSFKEIEFVLRKNIDAQKMAYEIIDKVNKNTKEKKDNASITLYKVGAIV